MVRQLTICTSSKEMGMDVRSRFATSCCDERNKWVTSRESSFYREIPQRIRTIMRAYLGPNAGSSRFDVKFIRNSAHLTVISGQRDAFGLEDLR